jgi:hypothetical protein
MRIFPGDSDQLQQGILHGEEWAHVAHCHFLLHTQADSLALAVAAGGVMRAG